MTLDGAIKHAEEIANANERLCDTVHPAMQLSDYGKCAEEHRQLAGWLKELKELSEQTEWIPVSEKLPKENGWYQCTVVINDLPRTMELFYKNSKWIDNRRIDMFNTYDIYGYGCTDEKHKLSYQELISEFDWTENVIAWQLLPEPYAEGKE